MSLAEGETIMPNEITLRPTVDALEKVIGQLKTAEKKTRGPEKKQLNLKIKKLVLLREIFIFECGRAYPVFPIKKP
jgi:hypothetical protein